MMEKSVDGLRAAHHHLILDITQSWTFLGILVFFKSKTKYK
jgi:hypothetical protein